MRERGPSAGSWPAMCADPRDGGRCAFTATRRRRTSGSRGSARAWTRRASRSRRPRATCSRASTARRRGRTLRAIGGLGARGCRSLPRALDRRGRRGRRTRATSAQRPTRGTAPSAAADAAPPSSREAAPSTAARSTRASTSRSRCRSASSSSRRSSTRPYHEILGVPRDADRKVLRKAYFALSKELHPDRFFRRNIGRSASASNASSGRSSRPTSCSRIRWRAPRSSARSPRPRGHARRAGAAAAASSAAVAAERSPSSRRSVRARRAGRTSSRCTRACVRERKARAKRLFEARHGVVRGGPLARGGRRRAPRDRVRSVERDLQGAVRRRAAQGARGAREASCVREAERALELRDFTAALRAVRRGARATGRTTPSCCTAPRALAWATGGDLHQAKEWAMAAVELDGHERGAPPRARPGLQGGGPRGERAPRARGRARARSEGRRGAHRAARDLRAPLGLCAGWGGSDESCDRYRPRDDELVRRRGGQRPAGRDPEHGRLQDDALDVRARRGRQAPRRPPRQAPGDHQRAQHGLREQASDRPPLRLRRSAPRAASSARTRSSRARTRIRASSSARRSSPAPRSPESSCAR